MESTAPLAFLLSRDNSTMQDVIDESDYGYLPTFYVCVLFIALFGLSAAIHLGQAIYTRSWYLLATVFLGLLLEVAGWAARAWSSKNLLAEAPFMMQVTLTIIAPTPILAANFIILALIIHLVGPEYSRLTPRLYSVVFLSCDIIALVCQGAGGGIASAADDVAGSLMGSNIMLAGISFQVVIMTLFSALAAEFVYRAKTDKPLRRQEYQSALTTGLTPKITMMICALGVNTSFLFIRAIYRVIELQGGWNGKIIRTQVWFNVFDGAMIVLAVYTYNFVHPGLVLPRPTQASLEAPSRERLAMAARNSEITINVQGPEPKLPQ